ncbi:MAG: DUF4432 family protein [Thermomicrobiales bacterium]
MTGATADAMRGLLPDSGSLPCPARKVSTHGNPRGDYHEGVRIRDAVVEHRDTEEEQPVGLLGNYRPERPFGARVSEYQRDGMDLIVIENEVIQLTINPSRGADLIGWRIKPLDLDLAWKAPTGLTGDDHAARLSPDRVAAFIDGYPGGWQTIFPNGGEPSRVDGAPYGQHGEAYALPWDVKIVEDTPEVVEVSFTVLLRRAPFAIEKRFRVETALPTFWIAESATNLAPVRARAMWGQHITFGPPFLDDSCVILLPDGLTVTPHPDGLTPERRLAPGAQPFAWPVAPGPDGPIDLAIVPPVGSPSEMLYLNGFADEGVYAVQNRNMNLRATIRWDATLQPTLWMWQESGGTTGWPWYGRARVIGLEPFAGWPTSGFEAADANGSVMSFEPGERKVARLMAQVNLLDAPPASPAPSDVIADQT